ncbi:hypothetical protein DFJ73DRAFT_772517 [Zopfochytrium polystomum]|nr:hypothetical protein DFJ73DRAFT_772517 [Zopfochytrium polystomum]
MRKQSSDGGPRPEDRVGSDGDGDSMDTPSPSSSSAGAKATTSRHPGAQPLAPMRRIWKRLLLRTGYAKNPTFLQILSSELIVSEICLRLADPHARYLLASLCRRPTIQAHALCSLRDAAGLKDSDNFSMLRFCQKHLPEEKFNGLYSSNLIDNSAERKDTVRYLQKWKDSGLPLKYTENALTRAIDWGRIDVIKWWIASGLDVKYSEWGMDVATIEGNIEVLQFMKNSGLPLKYSANGIDRACLKLQIKSLDWWKASGLELKYSHRALDNACRTLFGERILNWWRDNNLEFLYTENAFRAASSRGDVEMLQWWKDSRLELRCDVTVLMDAVNSEVLDWWKDRSGTDFVEQVLRDEGWKQFMREDAREKKRMDAVEWWDKH